MYACASLIAWKKGGGGRKRKGPGMARWRANQFATKKNVLNKTKPSVCLSYSHVLISHIEDSDAGGGGWRA